MSIHIFIVILHVLGAGLIIGIALFALFLATARVWDAEKISHFKFIWQYGRYASAWLLLTGVILAASNWDAYARNPVFWTKMGIFVFEGILAGVLVDAKSKQMQPGVAAPGARVSILAVGLAILLIASLGVVLAETA